MSENITAHSESLRQAALRSRLAAVEKFKGGGLVKIGADGTPGRIAGFQPHGFVTIRLPDETTLRDVPADALIAVEVDRSKVVTRTLVLTIQYFADRSVRASYDADDDPGDEGILYATSAFLRALTEDNAEFQPNQTG